MNDQTRRRVRLGLGYLTLTFLNVGLWATLAPQSFYDDFPGFGRHWVMGDGPYNAHLVSDAGVGFLAVGIVLLLATWCMERRVMQAGLLAAAVHAGAHLAFHLRHPNQGLTSLDGALSTGGLLVGTVVAVVLLVVVTRSPEHVGHEVPV